MFFCSDFLVSAGKDASEVGNDQKPSLLHTRHITRWEEPLLWGPEGSEVRGCQRGRGILPGRGPAEPHPVPAPTSLPAQWRLQWLGGLMFDQDLPWKCLPLNKCRNGPNEARVLDQFILKSHEEPGCWKSFSSPTNLLPVHSFLLVAAFYSTTSCVQADSSLLTEKYSQIFCFHILTISLCPKILNICDILSHFSTSIRTLFIKNIHFLLQNGLKYYIDLC